MANKNFTEFSLAELYTGGYIVGYINSGVNGERRFDISGFALQSDLHDATTVAGNGINLTGQAISLNLGTGVSQVSSGTHTHPQLHDAVTIIGNGLALTGQAINLNFGLGSDQVSSGNHTHSERGDFGFACSDETTNISTGIAKITFRMPWGMNLTGIRGSVNTAPTGANIIIDLNKTGLSVLSTKLSIDTSEKTSTTAASQVVISTATLEDDSEMTVDFDQVGLDLAVGKGVKIWLLGSRL